MVFSIVYTCNVLVSLPHMFKTCLFWSNSLFQHSSLLSKIMVLKLIAPHVRSTKPKISNHFLWLMQVTTCYIHLSLFMLLSRNSQSQQPFSWIVWSKTKERKNFRTIEKGLIMKMISKVANCFLHSYGEGFTFIAKSQLSGICWVSKASFVVYALLWHAQAYISAINDLFCHAFVVLKFIKWVSTWNFNVWFRNGNE
jgi:hypothetical protein